MMLTIKRPQKPPGKKDVMYKGLGGKSYTITRCNFRPESAKKNVKTLTSQQNINPKQG